MINRLTTHWVLAALLLGIQAWVWLTLARRLDSWLMWALSALFVAPVPGLLLRWRWARWTGVVLLAFLTGLYSYRLLAGSFTWGKLAQIVALGFVAFGLWRRPGSAFFDEADEADPAANQAETDEPMVSLVHLRRQQRYLEAPVLAEAISAAWNLKITGGEAEEDDTADGFVVGKNPLFVVMLRRPLEAIFMVHNHDRPYLDAPEQAAGDVPNLRFAEIIRDHGAWLAVDLMKAGNSKVDEAQAYRLIGKAITALADDDVLAIYCPQFHYFNLWSPDLESFLCGDSPLDALREEVKAPVFGVPPGEAIESAMAEARQRWPEFVAKFHARDPNDDRYLVKAPFTGEDGQIEHMWLRVFALEPDYAHGYLLNEPLHTRKLRQDSQVEVPVANISDWICPDQEGNPLGGFTQQVVSQAAQGGH